MKKAGKKTPRKKTPLEIYAEAKAAYSKGEHDKTAALFKSCREGLEITGHFRESCIALKMESICHSKMKDYTGAERLILEAKECALRHRIPLEDLCLIYQSCAIASSKLGKHKESLDYADKAISCLSKITAGRKARSLELMLKFGRCISLIELGELDTAERDLNKLLEDSPEPWPRALIKEKLAKIYSKTSRAPEAAGLLNEVIEDFGEKRPFAYLLRAECNGICAQSNDDCLAAVAIAEKELQDIEEDAFRFTFIEEGGSQGVYRFAIDYFLKANKPDLVFSIVQKIKARILSEKLPWMTGHIGSNPESLLRKEYPEEKLGSFQRHLNSETACLEIYMSSDKILLFLITHNNYFSEIVEMTAAEVKEYIDGIVDLISCKLQYDMLDEMLRELYSKVFEKILKNAKGVKHLVVIPHGYFHNLSFAGFKKSWDISYIPSLASLKHMKDRDGKFSSCLVLADPDSNLEWAVKEANCVAGCYKKKEVFLQNKATAQNLFRLGHNYDVIHIASHAEFNEECPELSCLFLSDGHYERQRVDVNTILSIGLHGNKLVVLSSCESGRGRVLGQSDEMNSIPRAFLIAGTRGVLVTFGRVDDEATHILMQRFHENLSSGYGPAKSLRLSQESVRRTFPHPYFWAGFQYIGV